MLNLESAERTSYVKAYDYLYSNRKIIFGRYFVSDRYIGSEAYKEYNSFRKAYICTESPFCTRYTYIRACRLKEYSSRFCIFSGSPGENERVCYYKVAAKIVISSANIKLSYTYSSEVSSFVCTDPITQRFILFSVNAVSERISYISRYRSLKILSPLFMSSLEIKSERSIYIQLIQDFDVRYILFCYAVQTERYCLCSNFRTIIVNSINALLQINNIYTERYTSIDIDSPFSERWSYISLVLNSERFIKLAFRIYSDRSLFVSINRAFTLSNISMIQARPEASDRTCMYRSIAFTSERFTFLEKRELYVSKQVTLSSDSTSIISSNDMYTNISISSDRSMNISGDGIIFQEALNKLDSSKITIKTTGTNYSFSVMDYTGALLSLTGDTVKKTLISSNTFHLDITLSD